MGIKRVVFALIGMVALLPMQSQAQELPLPAVQSLRTDISERLWGPARLEGTWTAKLFLLKGMNGQQVSEYSDFKKYSVETILKVAAPEGTPVR